MNIVLLKSRSDYAPIIVQQKQIFHLLGRGLSNTNIAQELDISVRTVENHRARLMEKLRVDSLPSWSGSFSELAAAAMTARSVSNRRSVGAP